MKDTSYADLRVQPLKELLHSLGQQTVQYFGTVSDRTEVTGCEFYDAVAELDSGEGLILLVTSGEYFSEKRMKKLLSRAAAARYSAVALKSGSARLGMYRELAQAEGIPVIIVSPHMSWKLFDAYVSQTLGELAHDGELKHDRLVEPLFALANEVAEHFGGSVAIEDLGRNIIAYSSVPGQLIDSLRTRGILARRVPASPSNQLQYRELLSSQEVLGFATYEDELPRVAVAIRAGTIPLGTIWAIDAEAATYEDQTPRISSESSRLMLDAAERAATAMLEDLKARQSGQLPREKRLRAMLAGEELSGAEFAELGIPDGEQAALLVVSSKARMTRSTLSHISSLVYRQLRVYRPEVVTAVYADQVFGLIRARSVSDVKFVAEPLLNIVQKLTGVEVDIFVPGLTHQAAEIESSGALALEMIEAWRERPGSSEQRLVTLDTVRPALLFRAVAQLLTELPHLQDQRVAELVAADPEVAGTVGEWIECRGNIARTAQLLGVHQNTVRHRLKRAQQEHGLDLDNAEDQLAVWLQLASGWGDARAPRSNAANPLR